MKHPSIRELYDYWNLRRGHRAAPARAEIEPGAIRRVLADTLILSFDEPAAHPFRIAGTRICAVFGRELKGEGFLNLWTPDSRAQARDLLRIVGREGVGAVASARGTSNLGCTHELELLVLALSHGGRTDARVLGAITPLGSSQWVGIATLGPLTLGTLRYLGPAVEPSPSIAPATCEGRIRHRFVVYDGGLA
jgi:hypothetical protein